MVMESGSGGSFSIGGALPQPSLGSYSLLDMLNEGQYINQEEAGTDECVICLNTSINLKRRETTQGNKHNVPSVFKNAYWGTLNPIDDCQLVNFINKQWMPKCHNALDNARLIQCFA